MKPGLYANIHKKQERIAREKAADKPVEKMRKPGTKGAPTAQAFKDSAKTAKNKQPFGAFCPLEMGIY